VGSIPASRTIKKKSLQRKLQAFSLADHLSVVHKFVVHNFGVHLLEFSIHFL
jgi:hypothetical protein